jgi:hypothetical protein
VGGGGGEQNTNIRIWTPPLSIIGLQSRAKIMKLVTFLAILKYIGLPPAPMINVGKSGLNFLFSVNHTTLNWEWGGHLCGCLMADNQQYNYFFLSNTIIISFKFNNFITDNAFWGSMIFLLLAQLLRKIHWHTH